MPSIAAHFACAGIVYKELNKQIKSKEDFYRGCILPDIIDKKDSHFKIKGKYYLVPDVEKYKKLYKLNSDLNKGYLCHLLLDKYFLDEFVISNIENYDKLFLFSADLMYNDYTNLNAMLVKRFKLDLAYINEIMKDFNNKLIQSKYESNKRNINNLKEGNLKFIDEDKMELFLRDISLRIAKELMR